jgi:hypothetical protein
VEPEGSLSFSQGVTKYRRRFRKLGENFPEIPELTVGVKAQVLMGEGN